MPDLPDLEDCPKLALALPCQRCGANAGGNQFHHLGRKTFDIASAPKRTPTALAREIASGIVLLCPECHAAIHAGGAGTGLEPLAVPALNVWFAIGAFQRLFTWSATTADHARNEDPGRGMEAPPGSAHDAIEAGPYGAARK